MKLYEDRKMKLYRHYNGGRLWVGSYPKGMRDVEYIGYITEIVGERVYMPAHDCQRKLLATWSELNDLGC